MSQIIPNGSRAALQEIFAVRVCREGEFDGSIVDDLFRNESHKFLYVLPCLGSVPVREMKQ